MQVLVPHLAPYVRVLARLSATPEEFSSAVAELRQFCDAIFASEDRRRLLCSPSLHLARREKILRALLAAGGVSDPVRRFLIVLLRKGRMPELPALLEDLVAAADLKSRVLRGVVETAIPVDDSVRSRLKDIVSTHTKFKADLGFRVNPEILGGIRFQLGILKVDLSLAGKLEEARSTLLHSGCKAT